MPLNALQLSHLQAGIDAELEGLALREHLKPLVQVLQASIDDVVAHLQNELEILLQDPESFDLLIDDYRRALNVAMEFRNKPPRPEPVGQQPPPPQPRGDAIEVQGSLEIRRGYGTYFAGQVYTSAVMRQAMSAGPPRYRGMAEPSLRTGCSIDGYLDIQPKSWIGLDCSNLPSTRLVYVAYNQSGLTCQASVRFNVDGSVVILQDKPCIVPVTGQGADFDRSCVYTTGIDGGCTALCLIYWSRTENRYTHASLAHISGGNLDMAGFNIAELLQGMDERDQVWGVLGVNRLTTDPETHDSSGVDTVTIPVLQVLHENNVNTDQITVYQSYPRGGFTLGIDSTGHWGEVPDAPTN